MTILLAFIMGALVGGFVVWLRYRLRWQDDCPECSHQREIRKYLQTIVNLSDRR